MLEQQEKVKSYVCSSRGGDDSRSAIMMMMMILVDGMEKKVCQKEKRIQPFPNGQFLGGQSGCHGVSLERQRNRAFPL